MSGYAEKQDWSSQSQYAASQGQGGYQQQPQQQPQYQPQGSQQVWNQQPYGQQQGGYQAPPSYPPQQGGEYQGSPYASPQGGYAAAPSVPGQYGSPQPQQSYGSPPYGAPPPSQGQFSALPPQGQYGSFQPPYGAPPQQQQWGGAPPQGPQGGPERRRSVCFKFSGTKQSILNSQVMDPYGKVPFIVGSDKKHTTVRASDGTTLAMVDWNHSIPVMHYGGKKLKCREWIVWDNHKQCVLAAPTRSAAYPSDASASFFSFSAICRVRILNHAGKEYHWVTRNETVYVRISHPSSTL
jgi:hypothetical protein